MKSFNIPSVYRSSFITRIKNSRKDSDPRKKDFSPTLLDFGAVRFYLARHFGFCYGVENAIEIAYKTIEENPDKRIFLLSEMIHNPGVNQDLKNLGVKFLMDTSGKQLIEWGELTNEDIVIIPAFGTTLEIEEKLNELGIDPYQYNTTCPFVQRVWTRSTQLGKEDFTVIIHGKSYHEETRATFSHSNTNAKSLIIRDLDKAKQLSSFILGGIGEQEFYEIFKEKYSKGFNAKRDLEKVGVVNQTTMLATETQAIADLLRETMIKRYGVNEIKNHFADTRDTLCYATNDNQDATYGLLEVEADFAIVVGGYNSSNTSHIVEICEQKLSTYFISSEKKILSDTVISHFDLHNRQEIQTNNFIPQKDIITILLTSGASCPDAVVESVLRKIHSYFPYAQDVDEVIESLLLKIE
ncbi:MAG: 4-hydroxy-3-methylbut-2-enyl diphosphate reductase [Ignavibacteriota bacterium]|nr:4-hydroxy-3-methylbut-2-enyl diphosphate reductase [Ignavibacteriota bacterium]MCO6449030.1 4-hydroxy-3-methylbut-2-enyl diphosphate reductase [Ignavibacterium album]QKK00023.1 MAG: 4-hydroxy-3-methylbut-2-enyl diphosphate reductase [Ignavibacteriota bacterium]HOJ08011.1 4-hydroxy-3-methylbut-2-enyl diphosphate reductase [Ignavibacteriaceae bacterium]